MALCLITLNGCDRTPSDVSDALTQAEGMVESLKPISDLAQKAATGELEKAFTVEYKVVDIPLLIERANVEEQLTALGKERWDCFHSVQTPTTTRFICKRSTKTALRYLPILRGLLK